MGDFLPLHSHYGSNIARHEGPRDTRHMGHGDTKVDCGQQDDNAWGKGEGTASSFHL